MTDDPRHVTADFAIGYIAWTTDITLTQNQLRQWAKRGHIRRIGHNQQGRTIYDLESILEHMHRRKLIPDTPQSL